MAVRELGAPPDLLALYARAVLPSPRRGDELDGTELVLADVAIDRDHVAAYTRVCGFPLRDVLPPPYLHVLAFPLAVALLAEPTFPFPLPGLVHVANRIEVLQPVPVTARPALRVRAEDLRPHPRGRQVDLVAEAHHDGALVWRGRSTYLRRGPAAGAGAGGDGAPQRQAAADDLAPTAVWSVPAGTGRRYAAVSGDRNPIHLSALTARLMGFPRAIAHGMWAKARCLAALEGRLPEALVAEVAFRKPLLLPARVAFAAAPDGPGWAVRLAPLRAGATSTGAAHLTGSVQPLPTGGPT